MDLVALVDLVVLVAFALGDAFLVARAVFVLADFAGLPATFLTGFAALPVAGCRLPVAGCLATFVPGVSLFGGLVRTGSGGGASWERCTIVNRT